jgi:hypothetical protein
MHNQKEIKVDSKFKICWFLRKNINKKINDINLLIKTIKLMDIYKANDPDILEFLEFLEDLATEKYKRQQNNHNLMRAFLAEKVKDYKQIQYHLLERKLSENKLFYTKNVKPDKIMSNHYITNKTEKDFKINELETEFYKFTTSEEFYLDSKNKDSETQIKIERIRKYFALQFTRREFFLYDVIKKCLSAIHKVDFESLNLLDYLYIKYIYNATLVGNYANWLDLINSEEIKIYQIQYKKSLTKVTYKEAMKTGKSYDTNVTCSNLAITEMHTFIISELLKSIDLQALNKLLENNGLSSLSVEEIAKTDTLFVTIGSTDKLCYLMLESIDEKLFEKINFVIHRFWDECMVNQVLLNLLLKKDSPLNNVEYFKKLNLPDEIYKRANFMYKALIFSENCEKMIKLN